jgi:predicted nucleic-acid-binding protein
VIGLDTNVLLRFYLKDDAVQSPQARRFMSSLKPNEPGWVGLASILEMAWVLTKKKTASRHQIADFFDMLLTADVLVVEQAATVGRAIQRFRSTTVGFADCLVAESARSAGCTRTVTFDQTAARDLGMELIK